MRKVLFLLGELSDSDVDWLVATGHRVEVAADDVVIKAREPVAEVFVLLDGRLSVWLGEVGGKDVVSLDAGEVVGELSFLDSRPPNATVTAAERSTLLAIPREELRAKLTRDTAFAARFYRALGVFLASRLRQTTGRLGFGSTTSLDEEAEAVDELSPELLDQTAMAGRRFELLVARMRGR